MQTDFYGFRVPYRPSGTWMNNHTLGAHACGWVRPCTLAGALARRARAHTHTHVHTHTHTYPLPNTHTHTHKNTKGKETSLKLTILHKQLSYDCLSKLMRSKGDRQGFKGAEVLKGSYKHRKVRKTPNGLEHLRCFVG
jgi:hypothetical protein